ncbi:MAG: HNH endonuclease signature motif containing protein [Mycobacterium sp.]|nr:HNH endonuclease signature motif containing protein [Mycobacterium sp.]
MRALAAVIALASVWLPSPTAAAATCQAHDGLPDSSCTPGDRDPRVTQVTIEDTICVKGWSKSVRPPKNVTDQIKAERIAAYGDDGPRGAYELDHLIPLELGGASTVANLWPELWDGPLGAHEKDRLEDRLHALVCDGRMQLADAQQVFATDWVSAYRQAFG